jgi:spore coat protein A
VPSGVPIKVKTLNEDFDEFGRLWQRGGTDTPFTNNQGLTTFGRDYVSEVTENVAAGEVQAWDFYNNTGDTHPWHFHLVNVQIVGRGIFDVKNSLPVFGSFTDLKGRSGRLTPPDDNELGWKETVRMNPGEVTRVIMKFDLPKIPASMDDPKSPRTGGHEYVHHCHILEHEEHDMMRPLIVR